MNVNRASRSRPLSLDDRFSLNDSSALCCDIGTYHRIPLVALGYRGGEYAIWSGRQAARGGAYEWVLYEHWPDLKMDVVGAKLLPHTLEAPNAALRSFVVLQSATREMFYYILQEGKQAITMKGTQASAPIPETIRTSESYIAFAKADSEDMYNVYRRTDLNLLQQRRTQSGGINPVSLRDDWIAYASALEEPNVLFEARVLPRRFSQHYLNRIVKQITKEVFSGMKVIGDKGLQALSAYVASALSLEDAQAQRRSLQQEQHEKRQAANGGASSSLLNRRVIILDDVRTKKTRVHFKALRDVAYLSLSPSGMYIIAIPHQGDSFDLYNIITARDYVSHEATFSKGVDSCNVAPQGIVWQSDESRFLLSTTNGTCYVFEVRRDRGTAVSDDARRPSLTFKSAPNERAKYKPALLTSTYIVGSSQQKPLEQVYMRSLLEDGIVHNWSIPRASIAIASGSYSSQTQRDIISRRSNHGLTVAEIDTCSDWHSIFARRTLTFFTLSKNEAEDSKHLRSQQLVFGLQLPGTTSQVKYGKMYNGDLSCEMDEQDYGNLENAMTFNLITDDIRAIMSSGTIKVGESVGNAARGLPMTVVNAISRVLGNSTEYTQGTGSNISDLREDEEEGDLLVITRAAESHAE